MTSSFVALDSNVLSSVTGGADARNGLLTKALDKRFKDDSVAFTSPPKFSLGAGGIAHATGRVQLNGTAKQNFTADVDVRHHRVSNLSTSLVQPSPAAE